MSDPNQESEEFARARRGRNIAIALGLALFVVLIFVVTIVRLGANVAARPF
ncbi:MAG TPA: hypothetical protein VF138_00885 [Caulobacteraceae bacterium]